jgi:acyl phosphate:glycerol-3-phosphate acyltransferase
MAARLVLAVLTGYPLGAIPFAVLVGRLVAVDPRQRGERNPGAWNLWRLGGARAGLATFALDAGKGALAAGAGTALAGWWGGALAGLAAMAGHAWPPWTGFRGGGRAVATFMGAAAVLAPLASLIALAVMAVAAAPLGILRAVALGTVAYPAAFAVLAPDPRRLVALGFAYLLLLVRVLQRRRQDASPAAPG